LVNNWKQIAAGINHIDEVGNDAVTASADDRLYAIGEVFCQTSSPGAAVNENQDRRARSRGTVNVELLDRGFSIRKSAGWTEPFSHSSAVCFPPLIELSEIWRIYDLIVGVV
jgi:hypothetical protein